MASTLPIADTCNGTAEATADSALTATGGIVIIPPGTFEPPFEHETSSAMDKRNKRKNENSSLGVFRDTKPTLIY
jgi:hypothetical protein